MNVPTDSERLDFVEQYLCREAYIVSEGTNHTIPVRTWTVVTAVGGDTLRDTIDLFMQQRSKLTNA